MKRSMRVILFLLLTFLFFPGPAAAAEESFTFGRFGAVTLYRPSAPPSAVVLFLSGDGGWNRGVVDMARELVGLDALVVGIDITRYFRNLEAAGDACSYPAADLESLSKFAQKRLGLPRYLTPVLVGYSSGATLVYAVLVQAPQNTFAGAISLGFCPDLPVTKPLCRGNGLEWRPGPHEQGYAFLPRRSLRSPWTVLHGTIDQVCSLESARSFVAAVPGADIIELPKVGHGFSVQRNWLPQLRAAFARIRDRHQGTSEQSSEGVLDLPVVEVTAQGNDRDLFAVVLSGDGGWAGIDREIGEDLAKQGIAVVGLNSLQYFWTARTPAATAADVARLLRHYLHAWDKRQAVLIGYSFGADVLPFAVNRLPEDLRDRVVLVVLIGPGSHASFEFQMSDWLGGEPGGPTWPLLPEMTRMHGSILCLYGEEESDSVCRRVTPGSIESVQLKGGHHFGGHYSAITERIVQKMQERSGHR